MQTTCKNRKLYRVLHNLLQSCKVLSRCLFFFQKTWRSLWIGIIGHIEGFNAVIFHVAISRFLINIGSCYRAQIWLCRSVWWPRGTHFQNSFSVVLRTVCRVLQSLKGRILVLAIMFCMVADQSRHPPQDAFFGYGNSGVIVPHEIGMLTFGR